ncbi:MAG: protein BatD [Bacteroidales bacterium]|nr:protein BatD [Bacteroidales bacterium]
MKRFPLISFFLLSVLLQSGVAEEISFSATTKREVRVGERFNLVYKINAEGTGFTGPEIKDFTVHSGPHTSSSSSIQIINGQVTRSFEYTYTYVISAVSEGQYTIPPARIKVGGKWIESNAVAIRVVKVTSTTPQGGGQNQGQADIRDQVFIRVSADKSSCYQGEGIVVTYKLYTQHPITQIDVKKMSSFPGFWSKNLLGDNENLRQYNEYYNGREYLVAEVRKVALFPQRSGDLTIEPLELSCLARIRQQRQRRYNDPFFDSFFNDPFFGGYQNVPLELKSNPLPIRVNPLPSTNKPADFTGAVGKFEMKAVADKNRLKANEAINVKITVSGTGNIELLELPDIAFPPDFETYDPKITENINATDRGISGSKTFEYLLIPRNPGEFRISPVRFSYFDPSSLSYKTLSSDGFSFIVEKGEGTSSGVAYSGINQEDIRYIGTDILHIKTRIPHFMVTRSFFFGSLQFYLLLLLPLLLFLAFVIIWKKELRKRSDLALVRNRKATQVARKRLKNALYLLKEKNQDAFYVEISQAMWGYLSDKFSIPMAQLSMDTVSETLEAKHVSQDRIQQFLDTLNRCEFERFAPHRDASSMDQIYQEAVRFISELENEMK